MHLETVTVAVVAKMLTLTERRVQQLVEAGVIPRTAKGEYDLFAVVPAYLASLKTRAQGGLGDQRRLLKAKADLAELDLQKAQDEVVSVAVVGEVWAEVCVNLKARLRSIPSKITPLVAPETNPGAVHALLLDAIDEALTELADEPLKDGDSTDAGTPVDAAPLQA